MARVFLRAKSNVVLDGEPYLIERQCSDGVWVLRHKHTERPVEQTTDQLFDAYVAGLLKFQSQGIRTISNPRRSRDEAFQEFVPPIATDVDAAKIRLAYVRAVVGLPYSQDRIEPAIDQVWKALKPRPATKPGWVSVYRWARAYFESGEVPTALLDANSRKGNRDRRFPAEVIEICDDIIDSVYLTTERPTVEHALNLAKARTRAANVLLPPSCHIAMPTRRLLQRLINQIPAYDRHAARYGRDSARKKFRTVLKNRITAAPLQRGEIDHTRMDLFVVDDIHGLPLGRPWLTLLIDDYTRCILGFCLSFEPPSRATVARCLRHAFIPKTNLRAEYPDLKNDWIAFGMVSELALDNGLEFHSKDIENFCFEFGIEQHFAPRKAAWFKGKIERVQGTLNRGITISAPGKTFGGIIEREDYDPKKNAVVTITALRHMVIRWIVDVYHQKKHSALGCSPAHMWTSSIRLEDIPLMADPLRFDAIVGGMANRLLTHKGIEYEGLQYNSPDMADLRRHLGDRIPVDIRIDRSNLGSIIVLHPERGTPYRVPCLRPEYAEGLTEWQHNVTKRYSRQRLNTAGDVNAWLDSLLEISDIISREMQLGKRKGTARERMARWSGGKQVTAESSTPPSLSVPALNHEPALAPIEDALLRPASPPPSPGAPTIARKHFAPVFEERVQIQTDNDTARGARHG